MNKVRHTNQKLVFLLTILTILTTSLSLISPKTLAKRITTIAVKCTIPIQLTAWNKTCTLPKFDKKLGTLLSATIRGSVNTETIWKIENRDAGGADFRLTVGANADFKDPVTGRTTNSLFATNVGGINISGIVSDQTLSKSLTPFDTNFDYNGTSGRSYDGSTQNSGDANAIYPKIITSKTDSKILTDIDSLTFFAGTTGETFTTNIATRGRTITDYDTTNFTQNIDTIAGASAEVLYEYESPNVAIRFDNLPVIAVPGTDFVFNLVVQNMEASPTPSGVRATLTLPNGTTFDPSSFTFAGWTASLTGNIVTFVRTNSMAASLTERLPIKLTITNGAANNIALITKVEIPETDYDPTNNQRTANIPKNQPPILSTISPFSIVNSGAVFKLPANILQAIDPNGSEPSEFNEGITIDFVKNFVITRLPNSANGELFLDELGATPATLNQVLTIQQGKNLYFKPKIGFVGNVSFNFTANDTFDAKNPPITAIFNLTNTNSQIGTGQYYGNNSLFGALSWSNSSNPGQNQTNSVNPQNTNNLTNNSQISQGLNSQKAVQTNSTNNSQDTNNSSNNQTNQEQNLSKRLIFRLVNGEIFDENNNKLSSGEILVDKGGEIDKNKINQIIQKYLEFQSQKINSIQNKAIMDKMEIVIQQNGKIISKIITNKINNSDQELETAQNVFLEKENSQNAKNLVRTGAFENFGQMTIGVLAILGAIGLLWTYFTGLKKGKNENKIELGEQILR